MMDTLGKVFLAQDSLRWCLVCDGLFSPEESLEHARATCFPPPDLGLCVPIRYATTEESA
jgi:hypothetical protein